MPFVHIRLTGQPLSPEAQARLSAAITGLMENLLGKKAELTAVLIEQPAASGWSIGGRPVATAAHLEATITAGTNTAAEKARFIAEAMELLRSAATAPLSVATYVVVREVDAQSWGYDGLTQAARRPAPALES